MSIITQKYTLLPYYVHVINDKLQLIHIMNINIRLADVVWSVERVSGNGSRSISAYVDISRAP